MLLFDNLNSAYASMLEALMFLYDYETEHTYERIGDGFKLLDITENKLNGQIQQLRKINYDFCRSFANSIIMGDSDFSNIKHMSERAKQFANAKLPANLPANFSLAYGHRIKQQEADMLSQLTEGNRRAIIHIWSPDDYLLIKPGNEFKGEFACTSALQFFVRDRMLNMHVHMRSSNAYNILPIDIYNFTELQKYYANKLNLVYGQFSISFGSLHLFKRDLQKARNVCL